MAEAEVQHARWDDMEQEVVTDKITRRLVTGDKMMIAQALLKKGAIVPMHSHHNEQVTQIISGALRFWLHSEDSEPIDVRAGEILHIPANVPHRAEALEDTVDIDVISPPRQDWLDGSDSYFHDED